MAILSLTTYHCLHAQPAAKSQMDVFWTVYAEKPTLIGAAVAAISILEVISGIATTQGRQNGDRQVRMCVGRSRCTVIVGTDVCMCGCVGGERVVCFGGSYLRVLQRKGGRAIDPPPPPLPCPHITYTLQNDGSRVTTTSTP